MLKWKTNHTSKQCRKSLRKNNQWESEKQTPHYKSPSRRQSRMLNSWYNLIVLKEAIKEICKNGKAAYIVFPNVHKAYDKAWLDAIIYTLHKNGIERKNLRMIKKLNSNLTAKIQTRYGLTRKIRIKDSIRQGGVLSVIRYAALIDEISKELRKKGLGLKMNENIDIDSLQWMDDVCLVHHDLEILQEMPDMTNHVALKCHIQFGAAKCKVIRKGRGTKSNLKLNGKTLEEVHTYTHTSIQVPRWVHKQQNGGAPPLGVSKYEPRSHVHTYKYTSTSVSS